MISKQKSKVRKTGTERAAWVRASREFKRWNGQRIIGIVDYYGAVHSRIAEDGDDHDKHFGQRMHKCWDFMDGQLWYGYLEDDDKEAILRHLARKYSIRTEGKC